MSTGGSWPSRGGVAASVVDRGGRGDPFRDLAPRRSRRSRQPLGLAVSGYGYALHLQPPDLRALAAGALPDLAESPHCGVLAIHRGRTVYGSHPGSFRGAEREAPMRDIYGFYDNPMWGFLALVDLGVMIYISLAVLAGVAIQALLGARRR
jgi:hypothetical protein